MSEFANKYLEIINARNKEIARGVAKLETAMQMSEWQTHPQYMQNKRAHLKNVRRWARLFALGFGLYVPLIVHVREFFAVRGTNIKLKEAPIFLRPQIQSNAPAAA
jgi:hypothetical protein